jgi:uncharacterized protein YabN with tetrapyrrole methylase and pyrophosphatase domain
MTNNNRFQQLVQQTRKMIFEYQKVEQKSWGIEGSMIELSKQVGDLSKRVMVAEKYYLKSRESNTEFKATGKEIADELFDIWFCLVRIADYYKIDFEKQIDKITRKELLNFRQGKIK